MIHQSANRRKGALLLTFPQLPLGGQSGDYVGVVRDQPTNEFGSLGLIAVFALRA
jgi:hypothetical protein